MKNFENLGPRNEVDGEGEVTTVELGTLEGGPAMALVGGWSEPIAS